MNNISRLEKNTVNFFYQLYLENYDKIENDIVSVVVNGIGVDMMVKTKHEYSHTPEGLTIKKTIISLHVFFYQHFRIVASYACYVNDDTSSKSISLFEQSLLKSHVLSA